MCDITLPVSKSQDNIHSSCHYNLTSSEEAKAFQSFWLLLSVKCVPASLTSKNTEMNLLLSKLTASDSSVTHTPPRLNALHLRWTTGEIALPAQPAATARSVSSSLMFPLRASRT